MKTRSSLPVTLVVERDAKGYLILLREATLPTPQIANPFNIYRISSFLLQESCIPTFTRRMRQLQIYSFSLLFPGRGLARLGEYYQELSRGHSWVDFSIIYWPFYGLPVDITCQDEQ